AAVPAAVTAEQVEDPWPQLVGHPGPVVLNHEQDPVRLAPYPDPHRGARRRVPRRVGQQVADDAAHHHRVDVDLGGLAVEDEAAVTEVGCRRGGADHGGDVDLPPLESHRATGESLEVEQVAHLDQQLLSGGVDLVEHAAAVAGGEARLVTDQPGQPRDGGDRRLQVVGHGED